MKRTCFPILVLLLLPYLGGCSDFGFYWQAASGHLDLLSRKQNIAELLKNPRTDAELKRKLTLVRKTRTFAGARLLLPDTGGYTSYVDTGRSYVTMVVRAAPVFSLKPHRWCYWIIGCQEYRGYFDEDEAQAYAAQVGARGFDVSVRPVSAYSTLGLLNRAWLPDYFSDPVLNTFLSRNDPDIIRTLIHEMAHQVLFVEGDTNFNESFAVFVEEEGLRQFLLQEGGEHSAHYHWFLSARRDRKRFRELIGQTYAELEALYALRIPDAEKLEKKRAAFQKLKQSFLRRRHEFEVLSFKQWFARPLNNTHLQGIRRYHRYTPAFRRIFQEQDRDWSAFYERVREIAEKPPEPRRELLETRL